MISKDFQLLYNQRIIFEELFNGLNGEIYVCDDDYNIIFSNKAIKERINKDPSKYKCYQYIYNNDKICPFCKLKASKDNKKPVVEEIYNKHNESWYQTTFLSIKQMDNSHIFMIILEDITHYKLAEEKELEIELKFQIISDTALDSIIIIDSNNQIKYWNKSAEELFGYTKDEIMGRALHQLLAPTRFHKSATEGLKHFQKTGKGNAIGQKLELAALKKSGEEIIIELAVSSFFSHNEWHAVGIIRDITDKKRTAKLLEETIKILSEKNIMLQEKDHELTAQFEELQDKEQKVLQQNIELEQSKKSIKRTLFELEQTNKQLEISNNYKDRFLSTMSHELRTPLNAIIGFTDIIHKQYYGSINEKQIEYINYVRESSSHLLTLINNILTIAQIDSDTMSFKQSIFNINSLITNILLEIEPQASNKVITLKHLLDENIPDITADKEKIEQCILNLLINSLNFTPDGGKITIKSELLDKHVLISVEDNGTGIQDTDKANIFDAFYQANRYRDNEHKGLGIGLPLIKRFIEYHNGEIGFHSKYKKGSIFWFTLPLRTNHLNNTL